MGYSETEVQLSCRSTILYKYLKVFLLAMQSDSYRATGCYNLLCVGFIQTNSRIAIGAAISPVSSYDGNQYDITILIWKVSIASTHIQIHDCAFHTSQSQIKDLIQEFNDHVHARVI